MRQVGRPYQWRAEANAAIHAIVVAYRNLSKPLIQVEVPASVVTCEQAPRLSPQLQQLELET